MKKLLIEWMHIDFEGETCERCWNTGQTLKTEVELLNTELNSKGFEVKYIETKIDNTQISQSNIILFNGIPIEQVLNITVSKNYCESCTDLIGLESYCRIINFNDKEYEDIPAEAIRKASYLSLGLSEYIEKPSKKNNNCCSNGCC